MPAAEDLERICERIERANPEVARRVPDLFAAAREPKSFRLVPGAGHNDIAETAGASYRQYLHSLYGRLRNSAH